jgi:hypothetical protein
MHSKFTHLYIIRQAFRSGGFLLLVLTTYCMPVFAQEATAQEDMPLDERGRYIYYEVVEGKQVPADSLRARAIAFLNIKKLSPVSLTKDGLTAAGKFLISKTAFVLTRPSGEVQYQFAFEIKEDKYRFWLTDFVFIPYKRDRYANYVPANVKGTPLEASPGKLNAGEWASYLSAASQQAGSFAAAFKASLSQSVKIKTEPKVKKAISTRNW